MTDEQTSLVARTGRHGYHGSMDDNDNESDENYVQGMFHDHKIDLLSNEEKAELFDRQTMAAERMSMRVMRFGKNDEMAHRFLRAELDLTQHDTELLEGDDDELPPCLKEKEQRKKPARPLQVVLIVFAALAVGFFVVILSFGNVVPPRIPAGPYKLVECQEGNDFWKYYTFYRGPDSLGSNGFNNYVGEPEARDLELVNVTHEVVHEDKYMGVSLNPATNGQETIYKEPFVYLGTVPTETGKRQSVRLEGKRRFNRGLFIMDLRHMPAGCGVWPAFWLTDEANWPINGEIDIVEGVNYQDVAKTAIHTTKGCSMEDVPQGLAYGSWDTAVGIPDSDTGIPDMTLRDANNCFVYCKHQWLNQGCVAVDTNNGTLGVPLNEKGGGVFALEWDPMNFRIRTWAFTPHTTVPKNLYQSIMTASNTRSKRTVPDPDTWGTPYGYYPIGEGTNCPGTKLQNMRLVLNTAFCGSVAGNRYHMDCPKQAEDFATCNDWIASEPDELDEAYWKIRGVYVYERDWERRWV